MDAAFEIFELRRLLWMGFLYPTEFLRAFLPAKIRSLAVSSDFDPSQNPPDLTGRTIFITGGTSGIGKETVLQLSRFGSPRIILGARNAEKANQVIHEVKRSNPDVEISFVPLDLSSLASVAAAATLVKQTTKSLDILLNSAGIMAVPSTATQDGFEVQFGTNHLGHALLTKLLLPLLNGTTGNIRDSRMIYLSSAGYHLSPASGIEYNQEKLMRLGTWTRYGVSQPSQAGLNAAEMAATQSKYANLLHARCLAVKYPEITSISLHPGVVSTNLWDANTTTNPILRFLKYTFGGFFMDDVRQGAMSSVWAVTCRKDQLRNGGHYQPVGILSEAVNEDHDLEMMKLWKWTEETLERLGY